MRILLKDVVAIKESRSAILASYDSDVVPMVGDGIDIEESHTTQLATVTRRVFHLLAHTGEVDHVSVYVKQLEP